MWLNASIKIKIRQLLTSDRQVPGENKYAFNNVLMPSYWNNSKSVGIYVSVSIDSSDNDYHKIDQCNPRAL